jgi:hypothetical protein
MKHLKSFGLAAIAASALMGLVSVGTASATVTYNGATALKVGTVTDYSLKTGTSASLVNTSGESLNTCTTSTLKKKITNAGSSTTTTTGEVTQLTWGSCTFPTATVILGKLETHHITGTTNGTLTSDAEIGVTINTVFFGSCVYGVKSGTDLGVGTGGNPSTFHVNTVAIKLSGSAFACPETTKFTATYTSTEPSGDIHVEAS